MLRSEHSIVIYDFNTMTVHPDRLRRGRDDEYVPAIGDCISIYQNGVGRCRQVLHREVADRLETLAGCPPRRIASFCKLLDDASSYRSDSKAAVELRLRLFQTAASLHPIVSVREGIFEHDLESARQRVSDELGVEWPAIESGLFADVIELQSLETFDDGLSATNILSRYNVAQTQAALYRATRVRVDAFADFKMIVSHAKLARLMHRIDRIDHPRSGYRFELDGPSSAIRETRRYGIGFAKLLTTLLRCSEWRLQAIVQGPGGRSFRLRVSPSDGLVCEAKPDDSFDSDLERDIESVWRKRPVEDWALEHESELLYSGQSVLTPDFALRHKDGQLIHVEAVGFWTPEYLAEKTRRLADSLTRDPGRCWLLIFPKNKVKVAQQLSETLTIPYVVFSKRSNPADWIAAAMRGITRH